MLFACLQNYINKNVFILTSPFLCVSSEGMMTLMLLLVGVLRSLCNARDGCTATLIDSEAVETGGVCD